MSDANVPLRAVLVESYDLLVKQLERRLSSSELAHEALHDTYLGLEGGREIRPISQPIGYLIRTAINFARMRQRAGKRLLSVAEIETAYQLADEAPNPAMVAEAVSELEAVKRAYETLPLRRKAILLASAKEGLSSREIARRYGLSIRTIDLELQAAREHCARLVKKNQKK
jgi:RNA polymerase sigma-70 factor (ECF subfamily)